MSGYHYFASIVGDAQHEVSTGAPAIYQRTDGFEIYILKHPNLVENGILEQAKKYNWKMNILKVKADSKKFITGVADNWKRDEAANSLYVDVDTSNYGFNSTPLYFASLYGDSRHCIMAGISSIYIPSKTGFRVHIISVDGNKITPEYAHSYKWKLHWLAIPQNPKKEKKVMKERTVKRKVKSLQDIVDLIEDMMISPDEFVKKKEFNEFESKIGFLLKHGTPLDRYSDLAQIQAQSICTALAPRDTHVYAVQRECSDKAPTCAEVCTKIYDEEDKKNGKCIDSLHIYKNTGFNELYKKGLR